MDEREVLELCEETFCRDGALASVRAAMPPEGELAALAELFKVFGDSTRIRILYILDRGELCVCEIAALLGLTQPAASYQLKALKRSRLVKSRREGKTVYYSLADDHVAVIIGMAKEHLEETNYEKDL